MFNIIISTLENLKFGWVNISEWHLFCQICQFSHARILRYTVMVIRIQYNIWSELFCVHLFCSISMAISIALTSLNLIIERKSGLFDRSWVAGKSIYSNANHIWSYYTSICRCHCSGGDSITDDILWCDSVHSSCHIDHIWCLCCECEWITWPTSQAVRGAPIVFIGIGTDMAILVVSVISVKCTQKLPICIHHSQALCYLYYILIAKLLRNDC